MATRLTHAISLAALVGALAVSAAEAQYRRDLASAAAVKASPALPPTSTFPVQLVLDDDQAESTFGVVDGGGDARQFLWLNAFSPVTGFQLQQIWVLFPAGQGIAPGDPIELVVYFDNDADPSTGATLVTVQAETVQFANGNDFSIYDLDTPVLVPSGTDVLIGVVNRFTSASVPSTTEPAALDTTASQGRSWVAVWTGDPPSPPTLPADSLNALIDDIRQGGGNFMIRAFGNDDAALFAVPALDGVGLAALALILAAFACWFVRR